ncbi:hypothetical protein BT69DRAFT_266032 [Atractiella rhizophila]|nr:hypothetical protein BT69DRAFT_266032 [Atractiella rhizophila]
MPMMLNGGLITILQANLPSPASTPMKQYHLPTMVTTRQIRKEPRAPVRRKRSFFGWIKFLLTTLAFWTLITYFASCKLSSPASSSDLCAKADQLSHLRDQYLIQPTLSFARTHLDPHVRPYYEPASEVLQESFSKYYTGPIKKYGDASVSYVSSNWENNVKPVLATVPAKAVYGARQTKAVVFETVEPHVPEQVKEYAQLAQRAWDDYVHTVYLQILKAGNELSLQAQTYAPIVKSYYRRYAIPAFKSVHKTSSVVYKSYLLPASKEAWRIVTDIIVPWINAKVTPVVQQAYAKWVEPHVEKVYKRKEAPVAVQPSPSTPVASTSASNLQPTLSSASVEETASSSVITSTSKTQEPTTTASQASSSTLAEVTDATAAASIDDEEDEDDLEGQ